MEIGPIQFDFLATCLVKIDERQQKIKTVRTNRQSNLGASCQSIFSHLPREKEKMAGMSSILGCKQVSEVRRKMKAPALAGLLSATRHHLPSRAQLSPFWRGISCVSPVPPPPPGGPPFGLGQHLAPAPPRQ